MQLNDFIKEEGKKSVTIQGKEHDGFVDYIRSKEELIKILKKKHDHASVYGIVRLFAEDNIAVADNVTINVNADDIYKFREYDRDPSSGWTGTMDAEEYEELKADIQQNGIKDAAVFVMEQLPGGKVNIRIGEGNHRLRIAKELGIKIPIRFSYKK